MLSALSSYSSVSTNDINAAREFYGDTLELSSVENDMGLMYELPGGGHLFVYEKPDHQPAVFTVLNFVVDSIDHTVDHLAVDHGITFERYDTLPAEQDEKGILRGKAAGQGPDIAWFEDPAGNIIAVLEN